MGQIFEGLNGVYYVDDRNGRLTGSILSGEVSISAVTVSNTEIIYYANGNIYLSYNPAAPTLATLQKLETGKNYIVKAKSSYDLPGITDATLQSVITSTLKQPASVANASSGLGQLQVSWTPPSVGGDPSSYKVQYSKDGGNYTGQQLINHPTLLYTYTGLSPGLYTSRVCATTAGIDSEWKYSSLPVSVLASSATYDTVLTIVSNNTPETGQSVIFNGLVGDELKFTAISTGGTSMLQLVLLIGGLAVAQVDFPSRYLGKRFSYKRSLTNTTYNTSDCVFTEGELTLV